MTITFFMEGFPNKIVSSSYCNKLTSKLFLFNLNPQNKLWFLVSFISPLNPFPTVVNKKDWRIPCLGLFSILKSFVGISFIKIDTKFEFKHHLIPYIYFSLKVILVIIYINKSHLTKSYNFFESTLNIIYPFFSLLILFIALFLMITLCIKLLSLKMSLYFDL